MCDALFAISWAQLSWTTSAYKHVPPRCGWKFPLHLLFSGSSCSPPLSSLPSISHSAHAAPLQVCICCLTGQIEDLSAHNFLPIYSVAGRQTALITKVTNKLGGGGGSHKQEATDRQEARRVPAVLHLTPIYFDGIYIIGRNDQVGALSFWAAGSFLFSITVCTHNSRR